MSISQPSSRGEFEIAILCALSLEYDAIELLFDERWDSNGDPFNRAPGDTNTYTTGRIGKHHVVLALTHLGKVNAATAATSLRSSYGSLRLVLLVGICGGTPRCGKEEILLGDVIVSSRVVQYDLGKRYPDEFRLRDTIEDNLRHHDTNVRNFVSQVTTDRDREILQTKTVHFLRQLQSKARHQSKYAYPGTEEDKLFQASYRHKHRISPECICSNCHGRKDPVCKDALDSVCSVLGCNEDHLEHRQRLVTKRTLEQESPVEVQIPTIHIGAIASGDTVMKSGEDRDEIAKSSGVVAFEMEGAGIWEAVPSIVVKGVCDYADCHKNKKWQSFAAATAAAAAKALLERYIATDKPHSHAIDNLQPGLFMVPFGRNESFVGREAIMTEVVDRAWPGKHRDDCQRTIIEGLGGIGKTQIALEAVFRIRDEHPECSIFWVPAVDASSFENAYRTIGKHMKVPGIDEDKADIKGLVNEDKADMKGLVKEALNSEANGSWLMVVDNADDTTLLFNVIKLEDYLPSSRRGSILFTTRSHKVATELTKLERAIVPVAEMNDDEALSMLQSGLKAGQTKDVGDTRKLLHLLAYLPLAIKQASAYMAREQVSASEYIEDFMSEQENMIDLLSENFRDPHTYKEIQNAVATTWLISFQHISKEDPLAAEYLKFMSFIAEKDIPKSLLPSARTLKVRGAIGTLKGYAFISQRAGQESFDMHRLVRLTMQNWLEKNEQLDGCLVSAMQWLDVIFPLPEYKNRDVWMQYLPHAEAALNHRGQSTSTAQELLLLLKVAGSHSILGQYKLAEGWSRKAVDGYEKAFGKEHPNTLHSMNNLANALADQGKHVEAEQMHWQTLKFREKVYGKEHSNTLISMNNLALALADQGKHVEAEQIHRQTLEIRARVLGKEHPETLISMNNLALALSDQGKHVETEQMHWQTLKLRERVLGKEYPETLSSMSNFANALANQGKHVEAEQIHRQTLEIRARALGKEHPDTLSSMGNLANALVNQGEHEKAEQMYRQTGKLMEKVLGNENPFTRRIRENLEHCLEAKTQRTLGQE